MGVESTSRHSSDSHSKTHADERGDPFLLRGGEKSVKEETANIGVLSGQIGERGKKDGETVGGGHFPFIPRGILAEEREGRTEPLDRRSPGSPRKEGGER